MIHFDKASFEQALAGDRLVVADFWAEWCGPCQAMGPLIEDLAARYEGRAVVGKVNTDEEMDLALQYGITSIPSVLFFKGGREIQRVVGVGPTTPEDLTRTVEKNL